MEVVSWRLCHGVCFVSCVISSILRLCHLIIILIILLLCYYYLIIILLSFYYYLSIILLHTFKLEKSITQPLEFLSAYLWSDPVGTRRRRAKALRRRAPPQDSNLTLFEHACLELELRAHLKHHSSSGRTSSGAGGTRHGQPMSQPCLQQQRPRGTVSCARPAHRLLPHIVDARSPQRSGCNAHSLVRQGNEHRRARARRASRYRPAMSVEKTKYHDERQKSFMMT